MDLGVSANLALPEVTPEPIVTTIGSPAHHDRLTEVIALLKNKGANINHFTDNPDKGLLEFAIHLDHTPVAIALVQNGVNLDSSPARPNHIPLLDAISKGNIDLVKLMAPRTTRLNDPTLDMNPLAYAVVSYSFSDDMIEKAVYLQIIDALLDARTKSNIAGEKGGSARDVLKYLRENGVLLLELESRLTPPPSRREILGTATAVGSGAATAYLAWRNRDTPFVQQYLIRPINYLGEQFVTSALQRFHQAINEASQALVSTTEHQLPQ